MRRVVACLDVRARHSTKKKRDSILAFVDTSYSSVHCPFSIALLRRRRFAKPSRVSSLVNSRVARLATYGYLVPRCLPSIKCLAN